MEEEKKEIIDDTSEIIDENQIIEEKPVEKEENQEKTINNIVEKEENQKETVENPQNIVEKEENQSTVQSYPQKKINKFLLFLFIIIIIIISSLFVNYYLNNKKEEKENNQTPSQIEKPNKEEEKKEEEEKEEVFEPEKVDNVDVIKVSNSINNNVLTEDSFYEKSLFVGDELMASFKDYLATKPNGFLGSPKFLTSKSLTISTLLTPISEKSNHPIYNNNKILVETAVEKLNIDRVYFMLGYNDILSSGIDKTLANYKTLISRIKTKKPNTKFYIINVAYMYEGTETKEINNTYLRSFNNKLSLNSSSLGANIINYAHALIEKNGYLKDEYSNDKSRNLSINAYNVLINILREKASQEIEKSLYSDAGTFVSEAELVPTYDNYNKALVAVNKLPYGNIKKEYLERLQIVNQLLIDTYSNKLKEITINNTRIILEEDKYNYEITFDKTVEKAIVKVVKESKNATVKGAETYNLAYGENNIKIEVKNNNEVSTYNIKIKRGYDTTLKSVSVNNDIVSIDNLYAEVDYPLDTVELKVVGNDPNATITGTGTLSLNVGENIFEFSVNEQKYKITIKRNEQVMQE
ncbi:MAG: hypothetical protein MR411_04230 [Tenericutes bacterium]|nr:hypothetical protein [Mycoplasmatota bacterium]